MVIRLKRAVRWANECIGLAFSMAVAGLLGLAWVLIPAGIAIFIMELERCRLWLRHLLKV